MGAKTDRWRRIREIVFERDNYTCGYCGKYCGKKKIRTIDHKLPKSRGGTDSLDNLVTACKRCNVQKGDRTPIEAGMTITDWSKYSWHQRIFGYDDTEYNYRGAVDIIESGIDLESSVKEIRIGNSCVWIPLIPVDNF